MKRTVLVMIMAVLTGLTMAQEKKSKSETAVIQTSAECGDCKNRIEEGLNYTKGVAFAELDLETKKVTVKFNSKKISLLQVKEKIASIGYSADEVKATQEAIQKLPACCQPGGMKKQKMD
ncbi:MAG: heavy-metal-associated domain-containing protein [Bacteroidota bacterium]